MGEPRSISFKCKCFKYLGERFVYPRNDTISESVRFKVESLQTSVNYHFKPDIPQELLNVVDVEEQGEKIVRQVVQKYGPLSIRPSRIHSGQRIGVTCPIKRLGQLIKVYVEWFESPDSKEEPVFTGYHTGDDYLINLTFIAPRMPKNRTALVRVDYDGVTIRRMVWSNGDKVSRDWKIPNRATTVRSYCCPTNTNPGPCSESSLGSYNDYNGDSCRVVILKFVTTSGLINGTIVRSPVVSELEFSIDGVPISQQITQILDAIWGVKRDYTKISFSDRLVGPSSIDLRGYKKPKEVLPIHNKWTLEEVGYYGVERPVVYNYGNIVNGELVGLPDVWSPPVYGYTGYMNLTLRC